MIPVVGCANDICRCSLTPVVDYDELRALARGSGLGQLHETMRTGRPGAVTLDCGASA
jgi:hypothetical protein